MALHWPLSLSCSEILLQFHLNFLFACSKLRILYCLIVQKQNLISLLHFNSVQLNFSHHPVIFSSHSFLKYKETRMSRVQERLRQLPLSWIDLPNLRSAGVSLAGQATSCSCLVPIYTYVYFYFSTCVSSLLPTSAYCYIFLCISVHGTVCNSHLDQ